MSPETPHNLAGWPICEKPIFIIGSPRSGTHGLAFALANHSQLWTHSESEILLPLFGHDPVEQLIQNAQKRVLPTWLRMFQVSKAELYGFLGLGINALFTSRNPAKRWIDKTPHYALMGDVLADLFPGAQFVHILRNGRRVVHSMTRFLDRFTPESRQEVLSSGHLAAWATDFREACRTWRTYVEAATRFCATHPDRCRTVDNEELAADPEKGFTELFEFLGVPFEQASVHFFRNYRVNSSFQEAPPALPSQENLSRPFQDWTMDQAHYFLDQKSSPDKPGWDWWPAERKAIFVAEAGDAMVQLGFATRAELDAWRQGSSLERGDQEQVRQAVTPEVDGHALEERLQAIAKELLPPRAAVLVVGAPGTDVLRLPGCFTFRFPLSYLPSDSAMATAHLEGLRKKGAGFLLFPSTEFWWFSRYEEFAQHLHAAFRCLRNDRDCVLFQL
jgi:hypothetical protein